MSNKYYTILASLIASLVLLPFFMGSVEAKCTDERPAGPPTLISAVPGERSVTLTWVEAPDPVTYYLVQYGTSKENLEYGSTNIGGKGTTSFTISELSNGVKYYFQVRAGNGCRPGEFSNTLGAKVGPATVLYKWPNLSIYKKVQVLGASTSATIKPTKSTGAQKTLRVPFAATTNSCAFTCQSGPLLIVEAIALIVFFYYVNKHPLLKPVLSVIIPIAAYLIFYKLQGGCTSYKFFCKYFLPLNVMIYIIILTLHKYKLIQHHAETNKLSIR